MGAVNGWTPNVGLGDKPVGMPAKTLGANGLRPFFMMMVPAAVNNPHLTRSRRDICPVDHAFRISWRFLRAFSASLSLALDAFGGRYIAALLSDLNHPSFIEHTAESCPIFFSNGCYRVLSMTCL